MKKSINKLKLLILKIARPILRIMLKYTYDESEYKNHFISKYPKNIINVDTLAPKIIYGFWTGNNELTPNRKRCIESIKKNAGIPFVLVTPNNLSNFILPNYPLHPAYEYLSTNHRSDYLRSYFMHHHGGGYIDIKHIKKSWLNAMEKLNRHTTKWAVGYPELAPSMIPPQPHNKLNSQLRNNYYRIIGNAGFIFKPGSPFTEEWSKLVEEKLSANYDKLKSNPGNIWGSNRGYPLPWASLQGSIFHPLCLKYSEFILQDNSLEMSFENYR